MAGSGCNGYWRRVVLKLEDGTSAEVVVDLPTYDAVVNKKDPTVISRILARIAELNDEDDDLTEDQSIDARAEVGKTDKVTAEQDNSEDQPDDCEETEHDTASWTTAAVKLLVATYLELQSVFKSSAVKRKQAWHRVAAKMKEKGYTFSGHTCSEKMKGLRQRYKIISDKNKKTGRGRTTWEFYSLMHDIMKNDPAVNPTVTVSSLTQSQDPSERAATPTLSLQRPSSPVATVTGESSSSSRGIRDPHLARRIHCSTSVEDGEGNVVKRRRQPSQKPDEAPKWFLEYMDQQSKRMDEVVSLLKERNTLFKTLIEKL